MLRTLRHASVSASLHRSRACLARARRGDDGRGGRGHDAAPGRGAAGAPVAPPARIAALVVGLLLGDVARELQEHVVERRLAQHERRGVELRAVEQPHRLEHRGRTVAVGDVHMDGPAVDADRADGCELPRRALRVVELAERHVDHGGAEPRLQRGRCALGDHPSVIDDDDVVGETIDLLEVLRREQDGHAGGDETLDHHPEVETPLRVEPGGRLVEEQHRGTVDERGSEVEPPPHSSREGAHHAVGRVVEVEAFEQLGATRLDLVAVEVGEAPDHGEVLGGGEVLVDRGVLAGEADRGADALGLVGHVDPEHACRPRVGPEQRGEHPHRRGLARAVGTEHPEDVTGLHLERHAVERVHVTEVLDQAVGQDRGLHAVSAISGCAHSPSTPHPRRRPRIRAPRPPAWSTRR